MKLAIGKNSAAGDAIHVVTAFAAPQLAGLVGIAGKAATTRADRFASSRCPTDVLEDLIGLFVRHASDLGH